jgi:hypothetical protein
MKSQRPYCLGTKFCNGIDILVQAIVIIRQEEHRR